MRPPEGTDEELYYLRGYEEAVKVMREEVPINMLSDLQRRYVNAHKEYKSQEEIDKLLEAIEWFTWSFPDVENKHRERYKG